MTDNFWSTSITNVQPNRIEIRGYDIDDLIGKVSFAEQIYLVITGNLPNKNVARVFEAILCAAIDHGAGTPSALAARTSISGGATINGAAAVGLLTMGDHHGAAIEKCMRAILELTQPEESGQVLEKRLADLVTISEKSKINFPGIGHRVHPIDPRVNRLKEIAEENGFNGNYVACIEKVSDYYSKLRISVKSHS